MSLPVDPHSFTDASHPLTRTVDLNLKVDFTTRIISGSAKITLSEPTQGSLYLDTRGLTVDSVVDGWGRSVKFTIHPEHKFKGSLLELSELYSDTVMVHYSTAQNASALQWLDAAMTSEGKFPFLFTQCQSIHARSVFPCQDTPRARIRYTAKIQIPRQLSALMSAEHIGRQELGGKTIQLEKNGSESSATDVPFEPNDYVVEVFSMKQPIPPYLFALAVGNLRSYAISPRCTVFAEPPVIEAAAQEFSDAEDMIQAAESLFGPYEWEEFNVLVMPPSFPYGGMENPRTTFLTPTVIAGDKSLTNVLAHELAHSWTGNLVTNEKFNDFWLNEGWTVYAERRILEAIERKRGKSEEQVSELVALHARVGYLSLLEAVQKRFKNEKEFTRLKLQGLEETDPDEIFSIIPYEKGYLFLKLLEAKVSRPVFDAFIASYISTFKFQSINTETFVAFLNDKLPQVHNDKLVDVDEWVNGTGIPADVSIASSTKLDQMKDLVKDFAESDLKEITDADVTLWSSNDWILFLESLPSQLPLEKVQRLDEKYSLSESTNAEILCTFLTLSAHSGYSAVFPKIETFLHSVGRMKFLRPLYQGLLESKGAVGQANPTKEAVELAVRIFEAAKGKYHPVAQAVIGGLVKKAAE